MFKRRDNLLMLLALLHAPYLAADDLAASPPAQVIKNPDPARDEYRYAGHAENLRVVLDLLRNECQTGIVEEEFRFHSKDAHQRRDDVREEQGKCLYLISQRPDQGKVIVFGNHPEASDGVNPFPAHKMGHRAFYNALLFSTSGPLRSLVIEAPSNKVNELAGDQARPERRALPLDDVQRQASRLLELTDQKLAAGSRRWTEDDRSGFYMLRLRDALQNLAQGMAAAPSGSDEAAQALQGRFQRWRQATRVHLEQLSDQLPAVDLEKLNGGRSTAWHPVVCPLYERSIEWTHLARDLDYHEKAVER